MAPQPPPPANSPNSAQPPRTGQPSEQAIHAGLRNLEAEIHKLNNQFNAAKEQGHTDLVAQVKKNLDAKLDMVKLFKQTVNDHQRSVQQARSNPQGPPILPGNIQTPPLSQMPSANPDSLDVPRGLPNRNGGPSLLPGAASQEATVTPEMAGQAQKPMDNPGARPSQPAALQQVQPTQQNPAPTMPTSTPVQQQRPSFKTYWEGSLAWVGFNATTRDRKELHAQVRVTCVNGDMYVLFSYFEFLFIYFIVKHTRHVAKEFDIDPIEGICNIAGPPGLGQAHQGSALYNLSICDES